MSKEIEIRFLKDHYKDITNKINELSRDKTQLKKNEYINNMLELLEEKRGTKEALINMLM